MIITTQYTSDYFFKYQALINSVLLHWEGGIHPIEINHENVKSYRTEWPTNRPFFCTMQNGEFLDTRYFKDVHDDEIICCVDADTIMNRPFTDAELQQIEDGLKVNDFLSVYGAYPPTSLEDVWCNLQFDKYPAYTCFGETTEPFVWVDSPEFTTSFLIATKASFRKLRDYYLQYFDDMTRLTGHHAGVQWLANWIVYTKMSVGILGKEFQCGSWYDGCTEQDGRNAVFNHTK